MKIKTLFVCQNCSAQFPAWMGKCTSCESWNSLVEENATNEPLASRVSVLLKEDPVLLAQVSTHEEKRFQTSIEEFDRVLGGGIVPSSVTLIGGDPGIGKSTLSLQVACALRASGHTVLYVSGEESVKQTKMR